MHDGIEFGECHHGVPPEIMPDKWIEERIAEWTINSPLTTCHVYGLPSASFSDYQFIPRYLLRDNDVEDASEHLDEYHIGVDVGASENGDPCVAYLWVGGQIAARHEWRSPNGDTMATAAVVMELQTAWAPEGKKIPAHQVHVDNTGVGKGVVDRCRQMGEWVDAVDFAEAQRGVNQRLNGSYEFKNLKAELLWTLRRMLEEREAYVDPKYRRLREQCGWYTYTHKARESKTVIEVREKKPDIKKKFGRSPDDLEAAVIGLARGGAGRSDILFLD
jgi:phage terminase large subunit